MVAAYESASTSDLKCHGKQRTSILKRGILEKLLGRKLGSKTRERIQNLNVIAGLPLLNVGWNCMCCGVFCKHEKFFDVDHIIPVCDGGTSLVENLQILCPNCHKKKSHGLDGFTVFQSFRAGRVDVKQISGVAQQQTQTDSLIKQSDHGDPPLADVEIVTNGQAHECQGSSALSAQCELWVDYCQKPGMGGDVAQSIATTVAGCETQAPV